MEQDPMAIFSRLLKQFGPLLAMFSVGAGAYFEARMAIRDNAREIQDLRGVLDRFLILDSERHGFGPDGFRSPEIRAGLEASLRQYIESRGIKDAAYWESFFQLNPQLMKPVR
jgi:hypothetical protein